MKLKEDPIGLKRPWITIIITVLLVSVILVVGNQTYKATEEATFDEFNQKQLVSPKEQLPGSSFILKPWRRIWVKSEPGKGSKFTFTLPVQKK